MAIYHFSAQIISRSNGSSSVGSSAYRSGEKIVNERTGEVHDYTRKKGVEYTEILTPLNAPNWASDRIKLWNEVERIEKNKNSQLAREINIALPNKLSIDEQIKLTREFVKDTFVKKGMVADISIHDTQKGNPHAHIMLTMRPFENGEWGAKSKKEYILDKKGEKIKLKSGQYKSRKIDTVDWNKKENLENWREEWAIYTNKSLERNGIKKRIDHRSYKEQGIEQKPTIHEGATARAIEKRGSISDRMEINRHIKEKNKKIKQCNVEVEKIEVEKFESLESKKRDNEKLVLNYIDKNKEKARLKRLIDSEVERKRDLNFFKLSEKKNCDEKIKRYSEQLERVDSELPSESRITELKDENKKIDRKLQELKPKVDEIKKRNADKAIEELFEQQRRKNLAKERERVRGMER